jgi:hypothetical protein
MATVARFEYDFYEPNGFAPGSERSISFGPWPWFRKAVIATAQPFDLSNSNRSLSVISINLRTTPDQFVDIRVRNVGVDVMYIYYVTLAEIGP